mmetsp:Transcript_37985/g.53016  ORF Transcript_37985/g.53016 Transcript_37985/m.53016 type:complete len:221 (+) Transcript_37985:1236-1898(+)
MKSPRMAEVFSIVAPETGRLTKEPMEVHMAARPTKEWKAATVWGRAMGDTFIPRVVPAAAPMASRMELTTRFSSERSTIVATMAPKTPTIPNLQPMLAVDIVASPPMAATQRSAETVVTAFSNSGRVKATRRKTTPGKSIIPEKSLSPGFLNKSSMRWDTTKPPKMLTAETSTARAARNQAIPDSVFSNNRSPPMAVHPEIAFVTDISGVWSACATPQTA